MTETWVNDRLHDILGISDKYISQFMIGLAQKSSSVADLIERIKDTNTVDVDANVLAFAKELYGKVPQKGQTVKASRVKQEEILAQQRKNQSYSLLSDSDDDEPQIKAKSKKRESKKRKRIRTKSADSSSDSDVPSKNQKQATDSSSEDEYSKMEMERKTDLEERDKFAKRLKEKDKEKTRNVAAKSDKKGYEEAKKRLQLETEDRKKIIPELRKTSRRQYLKKRQVDKLEELEEEIMDEQYLFSDVQLTKREKADMEYKKKVLQLAKEHKEVGEKSKEGRYHMPKDDVKPNEKYVEDPTERGNTEQKRWEEEHLHAAVMKFGAKDAKSLRKKKKVPTATLR